MVGVTVRLQERGENVVVYGCDIAVDQLLLGDGELYDPARMSLREWSHDDSISEILHGQERNA
jgi:hypothetical protein